MKLTFSKRAGYLATGCLAGFTASMAFTPILSVFAQIDELRSSDDLSEVQAYIRSCREVIPVNGSVAVYDNTELAGKPANQIGTINVGTPMHLTGVVREVDGSPTAAQVYMPYRRFAMYQPVGWVDASQITEC
ncbi:hypothetical protein IQ254_17845 [Nodosilinea sp. LEGE 07088]|uniref:hypothetical protein n=1 Tax=Nodosilinea sp. LEGE 07088 TaxID=2777968 RepID=UPI00187EEAE5|nr:hypothetical protein [Nodosilinea sp. LEGE 07088]MBE9139033.1 hypothetical protein [Nodosilinea sp. LEGE 07088]